MIGQTAGFTGTVSASVDEAAEGAKLYIYNTNATGGVKGQKIELISLEDKFDPKLALENGRQLIEDKKFWQCSWRARPTANGSAAANA